MAPPKISKWHHPETDLNSNVKKVDISFQIFIVMESAEDKAITKLFFLLEGV